MTSKKSSRSRLFYRELCDRSFYHFVKIMGAPSSEFVEPCGGDVTEHIHKPLCDFWQDKSIKRRCIFMPRDWWKSTVFTKWGAIWQYLQNNEVRILIASQNETLAKRFLNFIQSQILYNERLRKIYPELRKVNDAWVKKNRWSDTYCDLPRKGVYSESSISAVGVGGAAQSGHYDFIFIDDPVGEKHRDSQVELEKVWHWHDNTPELLVNPNFKSDKGSTINVICTFWGPGDYGNYLKTAYPEYQWRVVPALKYLAAKDSKNFQWIQDPKANEWETNWPNSPDDRFSTEVYHNMMNNPEKQALFWAQHMNNPKTGGSTKFDVEWVKPYRFDEKPLGLYVLCGHGNELEEYPVAEMSLRGIIDPGGFARTKLSKGSRFAMAIMGQHPGSNKKFMLWQWAGRFKTPELMVDKMIEGHDKIGGVSWFVEIAGQQSYIQKDMRSRAKAKRSDIRVNELDLDRSDKAKEERIASLIDPMSNGEWYIHPSMKETLNEIENYPTGLTRDLLDIMGMANTQFFSRRARKQRIPTMLEYYSKPESKRNPVTGY